MTESLIPPFLFDHPLNAFFALGLIAVLVLQLFNKNRNDNAKQSRELVQTLTSQVEAMRAEIADLRQKEALRDKEMQSLQERNRFLEDLFLQRGEGDQEYRQKALSSMEKLETIYSYILDTQPKRRSRKATA